MRETGVTAKPKMVLFDSGHTLVTEAQWDSTRGYEALLPYAAKNPRGLSAQDVAAAARELWPQLHLPARKAGRELHDHQFLRLLFALLELEFSRPIPELSQLYYAACAGYYHIMPHVDELLALLRLLHIRTGVVSNINESVEGVCARLRKYFPEHPFEFVICSSEYGVRKPDPLIFRLALAKANLPPEEIWFCGDNPQCDVEGACALGMTGIWYEDTTLPCIYHDPVMAPPTCPHWHIHDWRELMERLKGTQ